MTASWMVLGVLVATMIAAAAAISESAARLLGRPVRWVWLGAMVLTLVAVAAAPYRVERAGTLVGPTSVLIKAQAVTFESVHSSFVMQVLSSASVPLHRVMLDVQRLVPASSNGVALGLWIVASLFFAAVFGAVHLRMHRMRRRWPRIALQGTSVCMAPATGPAVFGLLRPEIVVPQWLLTRDGDEQRLVIAHESEHLRARDHLTLAAGTAAVVLLPWNPAVWWMYSRLRLAVELDCDARVLGAGVAPKSYGTLLIDLAAHTSGFRLGAPALIDGSSHLETRVMAMKSEHRRFARLRGSLIGFAALSLLVVACETRMPTQADVDNMSVASAERAMTAANAGDSKNVEYIIDGRKATAEEAHALSSTQIATVDVAKMAAGDSDLRIIRIMTHAAQPDSASRQLVVRRRTRSATGDSAATSAAFTGLAFSGLMFVDGVKVDPSTLGKLDPKQIESINVIKGPAAAKLYSDPAAENGVIAIKTKKGGSN